MAPFILATTTPVGGRSRVGEALHCHGGQLRGVPDAPDQVFPAPKAGVVERLGVALLSPPGNIARGYAADQADPGVPEGDEVLGGQFCAGHVIEDHGTLPAGVREVIRTTRASLATRFSSAWSVRSSVR